MRTSISILVVVLQLFSIASARAQSHDIASYTLFGHEKVDVGAGATVTDGAVGSNDTAVIGPRAHVLAFAHTAADVIRAGRDATLAGDLFYNSLRASGAIVTGPTHSPIALPVLNLPAPVSVTPGASDVTAIAAPRSGSPREATAASARSRARR